MVVIVIIGLLGTIAVGAFVGQADQAAVDTSRANMKVLKTAIGDYRLGTKKYPEKLDDLVTDPGVKGWRTGGYLNEGRLPKDAWGNDFVYDPPRRGTDKYTLKSLGADGQEGGEGFDADFGPDKDEDENANN
jgi:general secretion pathway protein G